MKIYELIKELNKKVTIKTSRVLEVKKHYLSLYRANMVYLYDKGYISDPTVSDTQEILGNIFDMGIKHISGVTGKIELNEDYIGYALVRYKDNEEVSEFLSLLLEAVKYKKISENIDKFYDDLKFAGEVKCKASLNLVQAASRILNKDGFTIDEGVLKCFKPNEVEFVSLNEVVYKVALLELGIDDNCDESLFVNGLTKEEEIAYSDLILNGLVKLDGKYASKLTEWLNKNKWSDENKFSSKNEGLYNWVVYIKSNNMIEEQSLLLNKLIDEGKKIVAMKSNGYYIVKETNDVKFPVGIFAVVSDDEGENILPQKNILEGYTGEVYSVKFLEDNGLGYVGCPIELFIDSKKKELFIDKEQTEMKDSISWFKHIGANITFSKSLYEEGVFPNNSLEDTLYKIVGDSEEGVLIGSIPYDENVKTLENAKKVVCKKVFN